MTLATLVVGLFLKPALVLAGAWAVTALLRRQSAAARHAVWAGAILATAALPLLSTALPPLRVPIPSVSFTDSGPPSSETGPQWTVRSEPSSINEGSPVPRPRSAFKSTQALLAIWLTGVALLLVRRIVESIRLRRMVGRSTPVVSQRLQRLSALSARHAGIRSSVNLLLSDEVTTPAVAGMLRPVILLPIDAAEWEEADARAVLVHELGHIARHDCLINRLADLTAVAYWCNPAFFFAVRRMRVESERACDDRVLLTGADPEGYAHLLLRVARAAQLGGALPAGVSAMARARELETRLLAVLDDGAPRSTLPRWMPLTLAALGILVALPAAALTLGPGAPIPAQLAVPGRDRQTDSLALPGSERVPQGDTPDPESSAITQALHGPDSALVRRLAGALDHQPEHEGDLVRERSVWALSRIRDGRLIDPLIEALEDNDWRIQSYAAWTLGTAHERRAVPRLIPLLAHPVWRLRAMAAYALNASHDPRAESAMTTALADSAWQVRLEAVEYIADLGGAAAAERLRPKLDDPHIAVRLAAERAVSR